jgi:hypothetical protein
MNDRGWDLWRRAEEERDRYKREREALLAVLFQPEAVRQTMADTILGESDSQQEPLPRQAGQSQSGWRRRLGEALDR